MQASYAKFLWDMDEDELEEEEEEEEQKSEEIAHMPPNTTIFRDFPQNTPISTSS